MSGPILMTEGPCNSVWPSPFPRRVPSSIPGNRGARRPLPVLRALLAAFLAVPGLLFPFPRGASVDILGASAAVAQLQFQVKGEARVPLRWHQEDPISLPEDLAGPTCIGLDPLGRILILDAPTGRIWSLDVGRKPAAPFGASDQGSERFEIPTRVFARWGLHVYTLDPQRRLVSVFDLEGRYEGSFDLEEALDAGGGPLDVELVDLVVDKVGSLMVLDRLGGRILLFDNEGRYRRLLGEDLTGQERLVSPTDLEVDVRGTLYVADPPTGRVFQVGRQGSLEHVWNLKSEDHPGSRPVGLAYSEGVLFVADAGENRITGLTSGGGEVLEMRLDEESQATVTATASLVVTPEGMLLLLSPEDQLILPIQLQYETADR